MVFLWFSYHLGPPLCGPRGPRAPPFLQSPEDGSRREVNLIPNAQIEDQLFNQLADKKATFPSG